MQHKYIIVSTNKPGVKEARERFVQVQGHLLSAFSALECAVTPLDNRARLEVLHKFFRISEEGRFNFEFDNCAKLGQDFRDSIAPDCIRFCKKHIEIEDFYAKCMTISEYPQQLDDKFISALLQQVPYIVLSIGKSGLHFLRTAADAGAGPHHCQHPQRNDGERPADVFEPAHRHLHC